MPSHLRLAPAPRDADSASPAPSPIHVVLADDHELMRASLRRLLEDEQDLRVIGEAGDLASAEREVERHRPHVLALDLGMHGGSTSFEAIGRLRERRPGTQVVGLTMHDDPVFAECALIAGAIGFVCKELADTELAHAIRAAARGEQFVSRLVAGRLDAWLRARARDRDPGATPGDSGDPL